MKEDILNLKPDYMSILIGVNDVWHEIFDGNGVDAVKFEMVYGLLVEELLRELPGLKLMLLEPFVLPGSATQNTEALPNRWEHFRKETDTASPKGGKHPSFLASRSMHRYHFQTRF